MNHGYSMVQWDKWIIVIVDGLIMRNKHIQLGLRTWMVLLQTKLACAWRRQWNWPDSCDIFVFSIFHNTETYKITHVFNCFSSIFKLEMILLLLRSYLRAVLMFFFKARSGCHSFCRPQCRVCFTILTAVRKQHDNAPVNMSSRAYPTIS